MIILVCGGRDFSDAKYLNSVLNWYRTKITLLVTGNAPGADRLAERWADELGIPNASYPANWDKYGKAAGPIRNKEMLDKHPDIDLVVAFPGGSGTRDMIIRARKRGIKVQEILPEGGRRRGQKVKELDRRGHQAPGSGKEGGESGRNVDAGLYAGTQE